MTKNTARISRRRFIAITAAAGTFPQFALGRELQTYEWRGTALGAEASLMLQHTDKAEAMAAIDACLVEVTRLESIFSLFRTDSALQKLNGAGTLGIAPADLRALLTQALIIAEQSDGAFDPTIQPLWALYAAHFGIPGAAADGPSASDINNARRLTGWRKVIIEGAAIRFLQQGMAVTLNGIAQGYITDKVGDLLKARGFGHVLINMGEPLAIGPKWNGRAWQVGIADPLARDATVINVPLSHGAVATSGGYGCYFDAGRRAPHILDPKTGAPAMRWASVSVVAPCATIADGLSTALCVAPDSKVSRLLAGGARAYAIPLGGGPGGWL